MSFDMLLFFSFLYLVLVISLAGSLYPFWRWSCLRIAQIMYYYLDHRTTLKIWGLDGWDRAWYTFSRGSDIRVTSLLILYFTAAFLYRSAMWRGALSDFRSVCTASVHGWGHGEVVCECSLLVCIEVNGMEMRLKTMSCAPLSDFLNNVGGGVDNNMYNSIGLGGISNCERKLPISHLCIFFP